MAWLDFLYKKAPERAPSEEPASPIFMMAGQPVRFLSQAAVVTSEVAIRKCPQLFRIVNFVSSAVQSVEWECKVGDDTIAAEQAGRSQIKAINDLLKSPNDTMTSQQLQYWIAMNLMLYARSHFKVGIGSTGNPNGIYPLAARYVTGVLNTRGTVDSYNYGLGENMVNLPSRRTAEKRNPTPPYAAEISFPSLSGLVEYNKTPAAIESLSHPIAIIIALMQRALDAANGHPNVRYVITAEKTLTKIQQDAVRTYLERSGPGDDNSGEVLFLYNTDIHVHKLDNDLGDIHSKLPLDDMTRQIAGVFGVPIALLGLGSADAAKYASNYSESRLAFWQDTLVPSYLVPIQAGMTQAICPPGCCIEFDLDDIPALWEGRARLGKVLSDVTFLTTNEKRDILDYPADDSLPKLMAPPPPSHQGSTPDPGDTSMAKAPLALVK
jgi:phage portal protein BeeE